MYSHLNQLNFFCFTELVCVSFQTFLVRSFLIVKLPFDKSHQSSCIKSFNKKFFIFLFVPNTPNELRARVTEWNYKEMAESSETKIEQIQHDNLPTNNV